MELRECPFCGGEAEIRRPIYTKPGTPLEVLIECKACHMGLSEPMDEATAIAAWNRRHAPVTPEPFTPTPIDPVAQHHPCNDCPFDPATCKPEDCERLKRYEAARKEAE